MPSSLRYSLRPLGRFLSSPSLMFFALPWLMVLLALGTVAQRYIGLYASQKLFFGSFVLWVWLVPLPGAYATLSLIAVSLIAKLLKSELSLKRAGTLLVHVSAIVLLLGGLISAMLREEGYVVLGDGESAAAVSDYRRRELEVTKNGELIKAIPLASIEAGSSYRSPALPFEIHVLRTCFPCRPTPRSAPVTHLHGAAIKLGLATAPYSREDAQNLKGIEYAITGAGAADGAYIAFEGFSPETVAAKGGDFSIALKPVQRPLPFSIRLLHFTKSDYPGTDEARAYRSDVAVSDNGLEWNTAIEMNQPLRYKGYTLYQSSFVAEGDRLVSVLAVVKNAGEWFPYIAIAMLCAGLSLHIALLLHRRKKYE